MHNKMFMLVTLSKLIPSCCYSNDCGDHGWQPASGAGGICVPVTRGLGRILGAFSLVLSLVSILFASTRGQSPGGQPAEGHAWSDPWNLRVGQVQRNRPGCCEDMGPGRPLGWTVSFSGIAPFSVGSFRQFSISSLVCSTFYPSTFSTQMEIMKFGGHLGRLGITCM